MSRPNGADTADDADTPDVVLSGSMVDRTMLHLTNPAILVKGPNGLMYPYVDPTPVIAVLRDAVAGEINRRRQFVQAQAGAAAPAPKPS